MRIGMATKILEKHGDALLNVDINDHEWFINMLMDGLKTTVMAELVKY